MYTPVSAMSQSKCAGTATLDNKLIVCGGFDRGECLNNVCSYDPASNEWTSMPPMLAKRGRFDVTVLDGYIYAVAGSSGQNETSSAERFSVEQNKWEFIASLPVPVSNIGKCVSCVKNSGVSCRVFFFFFCGDGIAPLPTLIPAHCNITTFNRSSLGFIQPSGSVSQFNRKSFQISPE